MDTLSLDSGTWDLVVNASGNIGTTTGSAAQAQDAASAIKTFQGEVYYDTNIGIPYWLQILGHLPPLSYLKAQFATAALTVPGIIKAVCYISAFTNRVVTGQVQMVNSDNESLLVNF